MIEFITAVLAVALAAAMPTLGSAAASAENQKASSAGALVVTNDNLQEVIKNSRVSIVGKREPEAQSAPQSPARSDDSPSAVDHFTMEIVRADGGHATIAPWRPVPGPGVAGPREIDVRQGDAVEITLVNDLWWTQGESSFLLTAADVIEDCYPDALGNPKTLSQDESAKCAQFPQFGVSDSVAPGTSRVIRFVADKAGTYKYYDGMNRSGYGILRVNP